MEMPKVSVWLTSYNHEKFIEESIKSILAQTYTDYELYIIDDCSSDNSWDVIQKYAKEDSRITAVRHAKNEGGSGLRDMLHELKGEYVAIAHSDDLWEPEKLERQVKILEEKPSVAACFTLVKVIDETGKCLADEMHPYYRVFEQPNRTSNEWLRHYFYNGNGLCHPSLLIRKMAYTHMKIFSNGLAGLPDFCQWIRLCKQADIYILQERLTKFRVHSDGSNTSGENEGSIVRVHTEEWFVLREYEELIALGKVTDVFPEANQYIVDGKISMKYALAKIMLKHPKYSYKLYGLQMLYELFQDTTQEQEIVQLYGYTRKKFSIDKCKYDIFHVIPKNRYLQIGIYLNGENGYSEENKISVKSFVQQTGMFGVTVDLSSYPKSMLERIRVDLDEGKYRKFNLRVCVCEGKPVEYRIINGIKEGDWDAFYTMDPQYELEIGTRGLLQIEGYVQEIEVGEVEQYFTHMQQHYTLIQQKYDELQKHNNMLQTQYELINQRMSRVESTIAWRLCAKLLRILRKMRIVKK